jgi:hypothetical protein
LARPKQRRASALATTAEVKRARADLADDQLSFGQLVRLASHVRPVLRTVAWSVKISSTPA